MSYGIVLSESTTLNRQLLAESSEQMPVPRVVHYALDQLLAKAYLRALCDGRVIQRLTVQLEASPLNFEEPTMMLDAFAVQKDAL